MEHTLTIPDKLYWRLAESARKRGFDDVERLLEIWQTTEEDLYQRQQTVQQIHVLREQLFAKYGEMPDSADLIREDRER